jgi:hypothetical protein
MVALRFVGGNKTGAPSKDYACRDGFGARVTADLGDEKIVREHRCGDGWSTQNSATMILGIGARLKVTSISVRWPSGKTSVVKDVPEGSLLTVYENPADSPTHEAFIRKEYRGKRVSQTPPAENRPVFTVAMADSKAKTGFQLRVYTTFATGSQECIDQVPFLRRLKETLAPEGVDIVTVPVEATDDNSKLAAFARNWKPTSRFFNIAPPSRAGAAEAFAKALGEEAPLPSTVITDTSGVILFARPGVPSLSEVRKLIPLQAQ